ncbi:MAG TPA: hypothetical protein VFC00_05015 [Micromonosporaceae bacterium]|nr:hypothetical protein [Micromonosporaceae bacterium]
MLFERRLRDGLADGSVTVAFRRWRRVQVVAGHRYRTGSSMVEVVSVDVVDPARITDADARRAGFASATEAVADLRGDPDIPTYRVTFRPSDAPDPRATLAARGELNEDEIGMLDQRLSTIDKDTLKAIADHPATRAGDLAKAQDRDRATFKANVRKLKELGLTLSLPVGYRLSPRGEAYLRATGRGSAPRSPS